MLERIKHFLLGVASAIDLWPAEPIEIKRLTGKERLAQSFERTGKALEQAIGTYAGQRNHPNNP
ncbi:MAG: hypothetical protein HOP00_05500 [Nitrospira sp.]|nr:hypothetical protein [Nitrospira sp.]